MTHLANIILSNGTVFPNPEERIREYCLVEVYAGYDDKHSITNQITREDIEAANRLYARYDRAESLRVVRNPSLGHILRKIEDKDMASISSTEWERLRDELERLLAEFLSTKGRGLAKATKILHLKRPHLFPILDNFCEISYGQRY